MTTLSVLLAVTVRASSFGFNPEDATEAVQRALNSQSKIVVIDKQTSPWRVRPLFLRDASDKTIVFEKGVVLEAKRGTFEGVVDVLLTLQRCQNVKIVGEGRGAVLRMAIEDYLSPNNTKFTGGYHHGLSLRNCRGITIEGLTIEGTGGDGIYVNDVDGCTIRGVSCLRNYRQGISVIHAANLLIENCTLSDTRGTPPEAGIDFEPNHASERLVNCVIRNCRIERNHGRGVDMALMSLRGTSQPVSVRFENCYWADNEGGGLMLYTPTTPFDPLKGEVSLTGCTLAGPMANLFTIAQSDNEPIRIKTSDTKLLIRDGDGAVVERPVDEKMIADLHPNIGKTFPQIEKTRDFGFDRVQIVDNFPGKKIQLSTLILRYSAPYVFYASKTANFTLFRRAPTPKKTVVKITDVAGKVVAEVPLAAENGFVSFAVKVPKRGFYFMKIDGNNGMVSLHESDAPVALDTTDSDLSLNGRVGDFWFSVPSNAGTFAFAVSGNVVNERIGVELFDPAGKRVWCEDSALAWRVYISENQPMSGLWKGRFNRPVNGGLDDYKAELRGIPAFLFLSDGKYWQVK